MKGTLTVLSGEDFDLWAQHASELSKRGYDPEDLDSHWGWAWETLGWTQ